MFINDNIGVFTHISRVHPFRTQPANKKRRTIFPFTLLLQRLEGEVEPANNALILAPCNLPRLPWRFEAIQLGKKGMMVNVMRPVA
jgi:hypothetical protein